LEFAALHGWWCRGGRVDAVVRIRPPTALQLVEENERRTSD